MIQDFQSAKKMHQLARALDMTDAELSDMMQQTQNSAAAYRQEHFDRPFDEIRTAVAHKTKSRFFT